MTEIERGTGAAIDLGCGGRKRSGYWGLDILAKPEIDLQCNLDRGIPLASNSVARLNCSHFLEHVDDLLFMLGEIHRVCKVGAVVDVAVPYYMSEGAFGDPTHKRFFNERTWHYFDPADELNQLYNFPFRFSIKQISYTYRASALNQVLRLFARLPGRFEHLIRERVWNYVYEMRVVLEVVK